MEGFCLKYVLLVTICRQRCNFQSLFWIEMLSASEIAELKSKARLSLERPDVATPIRFESEQWSTTSSTVEKVTLFFTLVLFRFLCSAISVKREINSPGTLANFCSIRRGSSASKRISENSLRKKVLAVNRIFYIDSLKRT